MKKHPLLTISSYLLEACGAIALLIMVYLTVFKVVLAETQDPNVKIAFVGAFMICSILSCLISMVAGNNALKGDSLINCSALGFSVEIFSILAGITGYLANQMWYPYVVIVLFGLLYNLGIRKTIKL